MFSLPRPLSLPTLPRYFDGLPLAYIVHFSFVVPPTAIASVSSDPVRKYLTDAVRLTNV